MVKIPKGEILWRRYIDQGGLLRFITTSKPARDFYYLYEVSEDGSCKKLGRGQDPPELEERYQVLEKIGVKKGAWK